MTKQEANERAVGRNVMVLTRYSYWYGEIVATKGEDHFLIKNRDGKEFLVSMFDVRYMHE